MAQHKLIKHWPAVALAIVVLTVFVTVLITFQVRENEVAIVMRFGEPLTSEDGKVKKYSPGLHSKLPTPLDTVWRHDNRLQCYELTTGRVEEIQTSDDYQITVTTYVLWKIGNPYTFLKSVNSTRAAESILDELVRNSRSKILGQHKLTELINTNPEDVKLPSVEQEILTDVKTVASEKYGISIDYLGFKHIGFPEIVSEKVFARMETERQAKAAEKREEGKLRAQEIRSEADVAFKNTIAKADAEATIIRAEADKQAAEYYAVFTQNPELAKFLRKLEALRKTLSKETTLVLNTKTPPYDLFQSDATNIKNKDQDAEGNE